MGQPLSRCIGYRTVRPTGVRVNPNSCHPESVPGTVTRAMITMIRSCDPGHRRSQWQWRGSQVRGPAQGPGPARRRAGPRGAVPS
eukprot:673367-Hanusia_phi.AAC.1